MSHSFPSPAARPLPGLALSLLLIPGRALALAKEGEESKVTIVPVRRAEKSAGVQIKLKSAALVRPK